MFYCTFQEDGRSHKIITDSAKTVLVLMGKFEYFHVYYNGIEVDPDQGFVPIKNMI